MWPFYVVSGLGVAQAIIQLSAPGLMWRLYAWRRRREGVTVQRTPQWDKSNRLEGIAFLLIWGSLLIGFLLPLLLPA
jgi:ABC-type Fe3+ transport system permease subunit